MDTRRKTSRTLSTMVTVSVIAACMLVPAVASAETPKETFANICAACHTIGGGKKVGPDLKGVSKRRSEAWIVKFVHDSQAVVKSGDPDAVALFNEFNKMPMPPQPQLDKAQIVGIIKLTEAGGDEGGAKSAAAPPKKATEAEVELGQALFQGHKPLANGGPPCNTCHEVSNDAIIVGGGSLARELTKVVGTVGEPGVRAIMGAPPFPVMQRAYKDKVLTEEEITALTGFLERANADAASIYQPRDYGWGLFGSGLLGTALLFGLYSLIWGKRKRRSVNQEIYDRQVKSI